MKVLLIVGENSCKAEIKPFLCGLFHMKTRVGLKYFVSYRLCKPLLDSNSPPFKLNLFEIIGNSKVFHTVLT